jgi:hypothetical protein
MRKNEKYAVELTKDEQAKLCRLVMSKSNKLSAETKVRAKILINLDRNSEAPLNPGETAKKCKVTRETVYQTRKQFCTYGLEATIYRKKRSTPPVPPKVTGEVEAQIIATACSAAPEGRNTWTMQMIADKLVLSGVVDSISDETVRRTLKKRN